MSDLLIHKEYLLCKSKKYPNVITSQFLQVIQKIYSNSHPFCFSFFSKNYIAKPSTLQIFTNLCPATKHLVHLKLLGTIGSSVPSSQTALTTPSTQLHCFTPNLCTKNYKMNTKKRRKSI